jgi:hypothetical protein
MRKVGKVINIDKDTVYVVTKKNEFVKLVRNEHTPIKGEIYAGEVYKPSNYALKIFILLMFFICLMASFQYTMYLKPKLTLVVKMNATVKLKINKYDRIIKVEGINTKGKQSVENLKIKNQSINDGLILLMNRCIEEKFIDEKFIKSNKRILVYITNNYNNIILDLSEFKKHAEKNKLKIIINNNGKGKIY